jgi:hypothetical protein
MRLALIFLCLCLTLSYATFESYNFVLSAKKRECFFEEFKSTESSTKIEAFVLTGGNLDVVLNVYGPLQYEDIVKVVVDCVMILFYSVFNFYSRERLKLQCSLKLSTQQKRVIVILNHLLKNFLQRVLEYMGYVWIIGNRISPQKLSRSVNR